MSETPPRRPPHELARFRVRGADRATELAPKVRLRRPSVPVTARSGDYTRSDWDAESFALFAEGADPPACPECGRTAFFGPRFVEPNRRYRGCRFCGFWQEVDGAPEQYLPTVHDCAKWPECSRSPYIWWVSPDTESYPCPYCHEDVAVALCITPVPYEDPDHPWWKIPQGRTQSFYQRLWRNWEVSSGRTVL